MTPLDIATDLAAKVMNAGHKAILKLSGGRVLNTAFGMPTLELHTIGRTSGQRRSVMLTAPVHDEHRVVLVASKGGDDRDPAWYRNLVVNPSIDLTVAGRKRPMTARPADPAEHAELWPRVVAAYWGYAVYQRRTSRQIPLVICEPRG
jgi:deazaflavin-dependent oxidoreductase (nitroreductase family)